MSCLLQSAIVKSYIKWCSANYVYCTIYQYSCTLFIVQFQTVVLNLLENTIHNSELIVEHGCTLKEAAFPSVLSSSIFWGSVPDSQVALLRNMFDSGQPLKCICVHAFVVPSYVKASRGWCSALVPSQFDANIAKLSSQWFSRLSQAKNMALCMISGYLQLCFTAHSLSRCQGSWTYCMCRCSRCSRRGRSGRSGTCTRLCCRKPNRISEPPQ